MRNPGNIHHSELTLVRLTREGAVHDEHLAACAACRGRFEFLVAYGRALAEEERKPLSDADLRRAPLTADSSVIRLVPLQVHPGADSAGEGQPLLLAARGARQSAPRYSSIAVFVSEAWRTIVRVIRDNRTQRYTFHVLSDDNVLTRRVDLRIEDTEGRTLRVRTNDEGVGRLESGTEINWRSVNVALIRPAH